MTEITCFVSPDCSYGVVKRFIDGAADTLDCCQFQLSNPRIVELFSSALKRGVNIRMLIGEYHIDDQKLKVQRRATDELNTLGADITIGPQKKPTEFHGRFLVADSSRVMIHTFALTDRGVDRDIIGNRELGIVVEGSEQFTSSVIDVFKSLCGDDEGTPHDIKSGGRNYSPKQHGGFELKWKEQCFKLDDNDSKPVFLCGRADASEFFDDQLELLNSISGDIDIYMQYIDIAEENHRSKKLMKILEGRVDAGHRIRILTQKGNDNERNDETQALCDVRGISHKFHPQKLHAKAILLPEAVILQTKDWVKYSVNSWDCGVLIQSAPIAAYFKKIFQYDWDIQ